MINKYSNILIFGYSSSGKAAENVLVKFKKKYKIYDDNLKLSGGNYISELNKNNIKLFDLIIISPGVSIYHKKILFAKKLGIEIVSELEFAFWFCDTKIIAVTGTNGKTTTVSLIENMLTEAGYKSKSFGNIGDPFSAVINYNNLDYIVLEVSSFQLEACHILKPYISIILNISPDHIDRHKTYKNYIKTKLKLFSNNTKKSISIINTDDEVIVSNTNNIKGKKILIGSEKDNDFYVYNNNVYVNSKNKTEQMFSAQELQNAKTFNVNILTVVAISKLLNIKKEIVIKTINKFNWLENRMEEVGVFNGVKYINDSKATNIHATSGAVFSFQKAKSITLLLGGKNKGLHFDEFFKNLPNNVENLILYGNARHYIFKEAKKYINKAKIFKVKTVETGTVLASLITNSEGVVLFSPACASFDAFKNYKERGECFKYVVKNLASFDKDRIIKKYLK